MRVHHVFANRSNVGDWLSARGIQALLRETAPDIEFAEHLCDEPFAPDTLFALNAAPADQLILIGGGGLFMDYFVPFWEGVRALARERTIAIWGVGYVDLKQEPSRPPVGLLREIVAASALTVVRDELTRDLLGLALPAPVPCPSLATISPAPLRRGVLHVNNYTAVGAEAYDAMGVAGAAYAEATGRLYREVNNRIEAGQEDQLHSVLELYRRSDVVLSSALHGCIIAAAMGRPVIAVSGDQKIESFMKAVGLGEWVLDQDELDGLPQMLVRHPLQPSARSLVVHAVEANRAVAREVMKAAVTSRARAEVRNLG